MSDFEVDLDKWIAETQGRVQLFVVAFAGRMVQEIKANTPVETGRLRASIQPTQPLSEWQPGRDITIGTNVEYARRIEYGYTGTDSLGRRYAQKGAGMFTQAVNRAQEIADEVLASLQGPSVALGAIVGGAEGAVEGLITAGPAGIVPGAAIGAGLGAADTAALGNEEGPGSAGVVGGLEGAAIGGLTGGPAGAALGAAIGTVEGATEGEIVNPKTPNRRR